MGMGRGSAIRACLAVGVALLCLLALTQPALGATYSVGWNFRVAMPKARFRAGDFLAFNYARNQHNVAAVNKWGYDKCIMPRGTRASQTGRDRFRLKKGDNYFICAIPGHCQGGMKIRVTAA